MIDITWFLENPEVGWLAVLIYLMWEIRGPYGRISELTQQIRNVVVVIRALARANQDISTKEVDEFLTDNGEEPSDFLDVDRKSLDEFNQDTKNDD